MDRLVLDPEVLRSVAHIIRTYCDRQNATVEEYLSNVNSLSDQWQDDETFSCMLEEIKRMVSQCKEFFDKIAGMYPVLFEKMAEWIEHRPEFAPSTPPPSGIGGYGGYGSGYGGGYSGGYGSGYGGGYSGGYGGGYGGGYSTGGTGTGTGVGTAIGAGIGAAIGAGIGVNMGAGAVSGTDAYTNTGAVSAVGTNTLSGVVSGTGSSVSPAVGSHGKIIIVDDVDYSLSLIDHGLSWSLGLPQETKEALWDYTGSYYKNINATLRGIDSQFESGNQKRCQLIHRALCQCKLPYPCTVFRGAGEAALGEYQGLSDSELVGRVVYDAGFMSTSLKRESAFTDDVLFEICVPEGSPGNYIGHISQAKHAEYEVLFDRDTALRITGVRRDHMGKRIISATMLSGKEGFQWKVRKDTAGKKMK